MIEKSIRRRRDVRLGNGDDFVGEGGESQDVFRDPRAGIHDEDIHRALELVNLPQHRAALLLGEIGHLAHALAAADELHAIRGGGDEIFERKAVLDQVPQVESRLDAKEDMAIGEA